MVQEDDIIEFNHSDSLEQMGRDDIIYLGMILNEVVSNSFKHAMSQVEEAKLSINIQKVKRHLHITVKDNGPGFEPEAKSSNSKSLGLELIDLFAKKLNATYSWKINQGTIFDLILPITLD